MFNVIQGEQHRHSKWVRLDHGVQLIKPDSLNAADLFESIIAAWVYYDTEASETKYKHTFKWSTFYTILDKNYT